MLGGSANLWEVSESQWPALFAMVDCIWLRLSRGRVSPSLMQLEE